MSLKAELETWAAALKAYDEEDFEKSLDLFSRIGDSSKIQTNMGLIYATLGEHEAAVERFNEATSMDGYLAVAYFQCGVSNFLLTRYDLAYKDFEEALLYLRGNQAINYEQLGLNFRLYAAEVLFNKGLSQIYLGRLDPGLTDMKDASRDKVTDEHKVIDDAIRDRGDGYTVFSIPVGVLYRPSEKKLKNAITKDYMGKAKLIAASDPGDAYTTFTGVTLLKQGISPSGVYISRINTRSPEPESSLNRSFTAPPTVSLLPKSDDEPRANLTRSKTALNVQSTARELSFSGPSSAPPIVRSNTAIAGSRPSPGAGIGAIGVPVRGLSVRKPGVSSNPASPSPPPPEPPAKVTSPLQSQGLRLTELYDGYLDAYTSESPAPVPSMQPDRIAAWASKNANPNYPPVISRSASRSAPASNYAPSSFGGPTMRRKLTRRGTSRQMMSRAPSSYEEEEEGYGSGEYEDGPFELVKIRVKLHYDDEVRGMALSPETSFDEFMDKIALKFGKALNMKFKDEDGGKVTMRDESDYDLAIETARESSKGKPEGKLEIWCTDP
ncbi:NADPH oxidase regulator NoxR [Guyanagaster necrorhizus]|uniref:NADPH oxidase regulator NoxR n=1 Tax=Guyanagaster necrorhizus TaxID=856835 RepID=A0A9P7W054_9AGAR|nr:NADPH oxidase regulator NoxR [Guyanagaster necrorhizus MCA 3950]KAG7449742.1 NADPH oxidase regulator NoxR [Guyanagaster necrorhizus MCA 3950]